MVEVQDSPLVMVLVQWVDVVVLNLVVELMEVKQLLVAVVEEEIMILKLAVAVEEKVVPSVKQQTLVEVHKDLVVQVVEMEQQ